jgi:hypothetical protein
MGSLMRGRQLRFASFLRNLTKYHAHSYIGENIPRPKISMMVNDKLGRSIDQKTSRRQDDQVKISPSVFSNLMFQLNLFYTPTRPEPRPTVDPFLAPTGTWQQGLIDGGKRWVKKKK